ncbi:alpha/beta hydrolase [Nocardioides fonticola]|uniref:Alpha/beta hydrolase n=1 Tax=Nocardioides fonticola TaxID=450363 RepID=A0ABP7XIR3_9ACTN
MDPAAFPNLDPDLAGIIAAIPDLGDSLDDLPAARAMLAAMAEAGGEVDLSGLEVADLPLTAYDSPASVRVYRPSGATAPLPGLLHLHGGGFCLGSVDLEHAVSADLARSLGVVVASVEYRLAPEHPYPAGLEDCYAGLRLLAELDGVDPARLGVHGQSAGGGLAAATALLARDRGGPALAFQSLGVPELDDRLDTPSMRHADAMPMWSRSQGAKSWEFYLGGQDADGYAAPARMADLAGLPPAYVVTCELDPLRDEGIAYAARLLAAGVSVELHSYPGTFHGVEIAQGTPIVERMRADLHGALRRGLRA